jgi:hypothetical protein
MKIKGSGTNGVTKFEFCDRSWKCRFQVIWCKQVYEELLVLILTLLTDVLSGSMVVASNVHSLTDCSIFTLPITLYCVHNKLVFIDGGCLAADSANSCEMPTR